MGETLEDHEKEITLNYNRMIGYRAVEETEMAGLFEHRMNNALKQWSDLNHYLGGQVVESLTSNGE